MMKRCLGEATILMAMAVASPAPALEVGTCDTPEGLSAKIKAEGHKTVATMERVGLSMKQGGQTTFIAQLVTATPDLKRWYIVNGDQPLSKRSTGKCVVVTGRNLEINDYRKDGTPTVTRYRFNRAKALTECDKVEKNFVVGENTGIRCKEFYVVISRAIKTFGERIALQGLNNFASLTTIIADPGGPEDSILGKYDYRMLVTAPKSATGIAARGRNFRFSKWVLSVEERW